MRTTLDIDGPVLRDLKKRQAREGKTLGRLVSDLLTHALKEDAEPARNSPPAWIAKPMGLRIDLSDNEAICMALDR